MKISQQQLKQIIKEEIQAALQEQWGGAFRLPVGPQLARAAARSRDFARVARGLRGTAPAKIAVRQLARVAPVAAETLLTSVGAASAGAIAGAALAGAAIGVGIGLTINYGIDWANDAARHRRMYATDVGDLSEEKAASCGVSGSTKGYISGAYQSTSNNTAGQGKIEEFAHASSVNATNVATLFDPRGYSTGTQY